jgi:hypothetical protein
MPDEHVQLPPEAVSSWILGVGDETPPRGAKRRLVAEARRLIAAITVVDVRGADSAEIDATTAALGDVVGRVSGLPKMTAGPAEAGGDDARLLERSGISGASNPLAAPLRLWLDGDRGKGEAVYGYQYEGPPGCVHGGFVAAAFDDLLGAAQTLSGTAGFTGTLTIRMVRPTPLHRPIAYEAGLTSLIGRKITVWARASSDGEAVAEAEGLFITPRGGMEDDRMARARAGITPPTSGT